MRNDSHQEKYLKRLDYKTFIAIVTQRRRGVYRGSGGGGGGGGGGGAAVVIEAVAEASVWV